MLIVLLRRVFCGGLWLFRFMWRKCSLCIGMWGECCVLFRVFLFVCIVLLVGRIVCLERLLEIERKVDFLGVMIFSFLVFFYWLKIVILILFLNCVWSCLNFFDLFIDIFCVLNLVKIWRNYVFFFFLEERKEF